MAALEVPGLSGEAVTTVQTDENGAFCISGLPEAPVRVWSSQIQNGVVHRAWAMAAPAPDALGCGGAGCQDLGVLTLQPDQCGRPELPPGVLCALSGPAGSVQTCPLCVASTADDASHAQALMGVVKYDPAKAKLQAVTVINCLPSGTCLENSNADPTLLTGQKFFRSPANANLAKGDVALAIMPTSNLNMPLSNAKSDGAGTITSGTANIASFRFVLNSDIPAETPVFVTSSDFTLADAAGRELGVHVAGGVATAGSALSPPNGTAMGCPTLPGDIDGNGVVFPHDVSCGYLGLLAHLVNAPFTYCLQGQDTFAMLDLDCSGHHSAVDLFGVSLAWGGVPKSLPPALDQNGNGCIDRCEASGASASPGE
jgi:hypothetical protein